MTLSFYPKACAGILTKDYLPGAKAFFKSLLHHNKDFNLPFIVFCIDSNEFPELLDIYKNIVFVKIDTSIYEKFKSKNKFRIWNYNVYTRLEIFKIKTKQLYYFDFDIIINDNIQEFFEIKSDIAAALTPKYLYSHLSDKELYFNAGVMIIGEKYLNDQTFQELYKLCGTRQWPGNELLLNEYFHTFDILDKKYNTLIVEEIKDVNKIKIIQYSSNNKPWYPGTILNKMDRQVRVINGPVKAAMLVNKFIKYL